MDHFTIKHYVNEACETQSLPSHCSLILNQASINVDLFMYPVKREKNNGVCPDFTSSDHFGPLILQCRAKYSWIHFGRKIFICGCK